jgi:hypothetical protein
MATPHARWRFEALPIREACASHADPPELLSSLFNLPDAFHALAWAVLPPMGTPCSL